MRCSQVAREDAARWVRDAPLLRVASKARAARAAAAWRVLEARPAGPA